ncbi:MAG TPA: HisA/HisF-related TIM barrel protein [Pyrinomonadaceae bacterium]|jgi:imidazole glycerol-phosphate synthase subunit HisF|nr:HisA/HisF-related TIM barrel protein [Pyrinomonadaceae bacterium]
MFRPRLIPVLLLKNLALVKSVRFKKHKYIGDPMNAVSIFNHLKADELIFLDIGASRNDQLISLEFVREVGEEAQMPFAVGGGIRSMSDIEAIIKVGAEKVVICTEAGRKPTFIKDATEAFGSTTISVCIDVRASWLRGKRTWLLNGREPTRFTPTDFARLMEEMGAGELIVQSIDRDGMMAGYDIELVRTISDAVRIPVIALGGAGSLKDLLRAHFEGHASAVAAGSLFVYQSTKRGVLINYPSVGEVQFPKHSL